MCKQRLLVVEASPEPATLTILFAAAVAEDHF